MGAYSADSLLDGPTTEWLLNHIARPVIHGMKAEDTEFRGILYCGLMMTARGPAVLEFNCRFGDPETQPVLMRLDSELVEAFERCMAGAISPGDVRWSHNPTCCVVLASSGYPGKFETGKPIRGLDEARRIAGTEVFHSGTARRNGEVVTAGGRVLGVTARGATLEEATRRAYEAADRIQFDGKIYRHDIAAQTAAR
jgi:phosphoribosylamine--glycine ligase